MDWWLAKPPLAELALGQPGTRQYVRSAVAALTAGAAWPGAEKELSAVGPAGVGGHRGTGMATAATLLAEELKTTERVVD